jgi:four helix bundle protein
VRNIAEGMKRKGRDPKRFYSYAAGSANEVRGVLDLADAWGWNIDVSRARQLADRLVGLLWGLTH